MQPNRAWLQLVPDAVVVVDQMGRIDFANQRCELLFGYRAEELVGQPVEVLVPERFDHHKQSREKFAESATLRPMGAGLDLVARHKNGEEIAVDISLRPIDLDGTPHVVASIRDVRAPRELMQKMRLQSIALEAAASGVMITRTDGIITWVNPAACEMSGYDAEELIGQPVSILKSGAHPGMFFRELWETVLAGGIWQGTIVNRHKSGALYHEEQTIAPVRSARGEITHFVAIRQDITARVQAEQELRATRDELTRRVKEVEELHVQLREQAIRDPLTGLFNRRYLDETLAREIARAQRSNTPLVIAVFDLDQFKRINDEWGHAVGDKVIQAFGAILIGRSRTDDVACRYGGEEFIVVFVGAPLDVALRRVEEWRLAFAHTRVPTERGDVGTTVSVGLASRLPDESSEALFARADAALYEAKRSGRNRAVVGAPSAPAPQTPRRDPALLRLAR